MAFLARLPGGLLVWRNCNRHLFPACLIPAQTKVATAFPLLRLSTTFLTFTTPTPSPSLLCHHHRRLFSTSNSNSNHPSPSLLRELKEAIKQLSSSLYNCDPASSTFPSPPSFNSKEPEQNVPAIDKKLQQLKVNALSLRHRQIIDHQRIWEMEQCRIAFSDTVHAELEEQAKSGKKDKASFLRLMWLKDRTMEVSKLSVDLGNSRLAFLHEIVQDLSQSQMKKDLQDDGLWNELIEGLMRVREMEFKDLDLLVQNFTSQLDSIQCRLNSLC